MRADFQLVTLTAAYMRTHVLEWRFPRKFTRMHVQMAGRETVVGVVSVHGRLAQKGTAITQPISTPTLVE